MQARTGLRTSDRVGLWVLAVGTALVMAGLMVVAVINVIRIGTNTAADLTLPVDLPLPADAVAGPATIVDGALTQATVIAADLNADTIGLLTVGAALTWISYLCVAGAFLFILVSMLRDRPFARALRNALIGAAISVTVLGLTGSFLTSIGTADAAVQLSGNVELHPYLLELGGDLTPLFIGFVLATGALLVQIGERMQHDTERLI
ncbi:hypothetical protein [Plantibacter sp. RU18]|uniref:hypothetical protein n=1 Tax=Plantibacter sp. RU18 TaxID=3158143 RepID=UPI003D360416